MLLHLRYTILQSTCGLSVRNVCAGLHPNGEGDVSLQGFALDQSVSLVAPGDDNDKAKACNAEPYGFSSTS